MKLRMEGNIIYLTDEQLGESLLKEIDEKKLIVEKKFYECVRNYYKPHERPKVFFKKKIIGRVLSISDTSEVEIEFTVPNPINYVINTANQKYLRIGRK